MEPTQALGSSVLGAYARGSRNRNRIVGGGGDGGGTHGGEVGGKGVSLAHVRERVEAAGVLRDMIDGYQVGATCATLHSLVPGP
jgi:hypothetical protein